MKKFLKPENVEQRITHAVLWNYRFGYYYIKYVM